MKVPRPETLAKYGLIKEMWLELLRKQGYFCPICDISLRGCKTFIDHEHVRGYSKMPGHEKRLYVRGILHYSCNRFKVCKNTIDSAKAVVAYLQAHHDRCRT